METFPPGSTTTFEANVSCAQPRRALIIAGTTLMRASVDSVPQMTMSYPPSPITWASTREVESASAAASAASVTKIASFAPMERPLRSASVARSGPMEIKVTVCAPPSSLPPCASTIRSASSTAYSSRSLRTASTLSRSSTPLTIFFSAQESGTCLMQTAIFMGQMLPVSSRFRKSE